MRATRLVFVILAAVAAISSAACTSPTGPKPAGDNVISSST